MSSLDLDEHEEHMFQLRVAGASILKERPVSRVERNATQQYVADAWL